VAIASGKDLVAWFKEQQQQLGRRIRRMPMGSLKANMDRAIAAVHGNREIGREYRRRKKRLSKRRRK